MGVRVTSSGNQQGIPFVISNVQDRQAHPDVLYDGANFIIVYTDEGSGQQAICGARVTPSGTVLDPNGQLLVGGSVSWGSPRIAYNGADLMMVYEESSISSGYVYGQRLSRSLDLIGSDFTISNSSNRKDEVRISYDGSLYLVVWLERESYFTSQLLCRMVSLDGNIIGNEITIATGLDYQSASFDLAFTGTNYLIVFSTGNELKGQYVSPSGNLIGTSFNISSGSDGIGRPAICYDNGYLMVTYSKHTASDYDVFGETEILSINNNAQKIKESSSSQNIFYQGPIRLKKGQKLFDHTGRHVDSHTCGSGIYFIINKDRSVIKIVMIR